MGRYVRFAGVQAFLKRGQLGNMAAPSSVAGGRFIKIDRFSGCAVCPTVPAAQMLWPNISVDGEEPLLFGIIHFDGGLRWVPICHMVNAAGSGAREVTTSTVKKPVWGQGQLWTIKSGRAVLTHRHRLKRLCPSCRAWSI